MDNVRTILCDMPVSIKGYTILEDNFYTIVLNSKLSYEQNRKTYKHELHHILNKDFYKRCSVNMLEMYAHA